MKKSVKQTIFDYNKKKRNCITVKSRLNSFLNALIIAFSLPENSNNTFVKNNGFIFSQSFSRNQPEINLNFMRKKLKKIACKSLNLKPTRISEWRTFLTSVGFNLIIFCGQNNFKILNEKRCLKNCENLKINLYILRCDGDKDLKYHYDVIRTPSGYYNKYFCKRCFKTSKSRKIHCCKYVCFMCKSKSRHDRDFKTKSSYCKSCNRYFYGRMCKQMHIRSQI